jgi:ribulose-5-phosphate 4-epimerase/fuculose-1-phosphate aldolase
MDTEERLIAEAAQANRALGASGQSDMVWGHASVRDPGGRGAWMKAAGWSFDEVTPARVALVSPAGEVLAGNGPRHIEYPIHTEVMNARPDVGCVVHTHAPAAVSFAALDLPLRAISHDGVEFADPQVARFTLTGSLINSVKLGRALATTIGDGVGCLIPQHGLVTVGPDPATAVMRAVLLARACHVQLQAMAASEIVLWSDPAEVALKKALVWQASQINAGYAFLCRQADGAAAGELLVER